MLDNDYGYIINIISSAAFTGEVKMWDYCASKAAAFSFSESLRAEIRFLNKRNIAVLSVCPWHIGTNMFANFHTKIHWLLPALDVKYVASKVIQAAFDGQLCLILPKVLQIGIAVKR